MIEFRCSQCGATLRVPTGTEGKQAKCPQCSALMTIPTPAAQPSDPWRPAAPRNPAPSGPADFSVPPPREGAFHQTSAAAGSSAEANNPFQSPQYAGAPQQNYAFATRGFRPTPIQFGEVFERSWQLFKANLGLMLGSGALVFIVMMVIDQAVKVLFGVAGPQFGVEVGFEANEGPGSLVVRSLAASFVTQCVQAFFWMGMIALTLKIARGEAASIGDVFSTGIRYPAGIVVHIGYMVATWIGFVMCIIPGVWIGLAFGLSLYMFLDQRTGIGESFQYSYRAMKGNKLVMLGLWMTMLGLIFLGALACFVGLFLALPFCVMLMTVAYLSATGQYGNPYDQPAPYTTPYTTP